MSNLGAALRALGEGEAGTARLDEAVAAFRSSLLERTRERSPLAWATTEVGLGDALVASGERDGPRPGLMRRSPPTGRPSPSSSRPM